MSGCKDKDEVENLGVFNALPILLLALDDVVVAAAVVGVFVEVLDMVDDAEVTFLSFSTACDAATAHFNSPAGFAGRVAGFNVVAPVIPFGV